MVPMPYMHLFLVFLGTLFQINWAHGQQCPSSESSGWNLCSTVQTLPEVLLPTENSNRNGCGDRIPYSEDVVDERHGEGYFQYIDRIIQRILFAMPMPSEEERALLHAFLHAKIRTESEYNPLVTSLSGYKGLGQLGKYGGGGVQGMIHLHYLKGCLIDQWTTEDLSNYNPATYLANNRSYNFYSEDRSIFKPECTDEVMTAGSHLNQAPGCLEKIKQVCTTADGKYLANVYCPEFNVLVTASYARYLLLSSTNFSATALKQRGSSVVERHRWASSAYNAGPSVSQSSYSSETLCHRWRIAGDGGGFGPSSSQGEPYLGFYSRHLCERASRNQPEPSSAPESTQ